MRVDINDAGSIQVHTNCLDLCFNCKNIYKCPLITALSGEHVIMHYSELVIDECGLYKK